MAVDQALVDPGAESEGWATAEEMKLAVQIVQGTRCEICGIDNPDRFDVIYSETDRGLPRVTLVGALCRTCKGGLDLFQHDGTLLKAAVAYLAAPPADEALRLVAEGDLSVLPRGA